MKAVDVFKNEGYDIPATLAGMPEEGLACLVLWLFDDNGVRMTALSIMETHFYKAPHTGQPVNLIAKCVCHIIDAHPFFESFKVR